MTISKIRSILINKVGSQVSIVYYGSRNKNERYIGYIFKIYRNIFTIKLLNGDIKSFSYKDILTKTIQIYV